MPARKERSAIAPERLALYDQAIAALPDQQRKGATLPYTSLNGHMFSFLTRDGSLVLRLARPDREAFIGRFGTEPVVANGAVLQEYVAVPDDLFEDTAALRPYAEASYRYVASLKPKPTTRRRTT